MTVRSGTTRRLWLAGLTLAAFANLGADRAAVKPSADAGAVEAVRVRAKQAGLGDVRVSESEHFVGIGNAPDAYRDEALNKVCEALAKTYQTHFVTKGIGVTMPPRKMTVVVLADRASYEAFKGEPADESEGGHFDVEANRLVTYDFRVKGQNAAAKRELNTFTLVHEATHQLTFNTGLLALRGDVPTALSEGLATYAETWRVSRPTIGKPNLPRLGVLKQPGAGPKWIPVAELLTDDNLFSDEKTAQIAYAESWLLVYDLLQTPAGTKKLGNYLDQVRTRRDPARRLADAEGALGDLGRLDAGLKQEARRLLR